MYNFYVQAYSLYKGLFNWNSRGGLITNIILFPVMNTLIFTVMGRFAVDIRTSQSLAIGMMVYAMNFILVSGVTQCFTNDRRNYTITYMYISRTNRAINYLSRAVFNYPTGLAALTVGMIAVRLFTNVDFGQVNWVGLIPAALVIDASMCAFSLLLGSFAIVIRDWINIWAVTLALLFALTGMTVPLDAFPSGLQEVFRFLPVTNALEAIRLSFTGAPFSEVYWLILREAMTGLVYFGIGLGGFILFERVARRSGALEREIYG